MSIKDLRSRIQEVSNRTKKGLKARRERKVARSDKLRIELLWRDMMKDRYPLVKYKFTGKERGLVNSFLREMSFDEYRELFDLFLKVWDALESGGFVYGVPKLGFMWAIRDSLQAIVMGHKDLEDVIEMQSKRLGHKHKTADYKGWDGPDVGW